MKKLIALFTLLSFIIVAPVVAKADDVVTTTTPITTTAPATTTAPVTTTAPETTQPVVTTAAPVEDEEIDYKEAQQVVTDIATKYLGEYLDKQLIADIVALAFGVISLFALIGTYIKYKRVHKDTNDVVAQSIEKEIKKQIKDLDGLVKPLVEQNEELKKGYETIMKVLVLMQDASPKGKVALIDYLGSKTDNKEIKDATEQVNEEIKKQEETKKEVTEKVNGEYENIF